MSREKKYKTDEERKAARREYNKQYYQNNKEKITDYNANYFSTPKGRASNLVNAYKQEDKLHNRGECTLTADWVVEHIFSQPCAHCGKDGWKIIGCNRLDNSLPHTPDNVEPCCLECNKELYDKEKSKPVYQYTLDGELVRKWTSAAEAGRNGYNFSHICACCRGVRKTHYSFIWSYANE